MKLAIAGRLNVTTLVVLHLRSAAERCSGLYLAEPTRADGYITISLLRSAPAITAPPADLIIRGS